MRNKRGFAFDNMTNIILWVIILVLAGFSIYALFKKFGLR
jgi:uncharacterized membrane protein (DUF373 family)